MCTTIEIWKDIEGFEGHQVSNFGRIKSLNYRRTGEERILKPGKNRGGYLFVILCKNGKQKLFLVHCLVAKAFIPNPNNWTQINHLDENKENNCVDNLEWCTAKYNSNFGTRTERVAKKLSLPIIATVIATGEVEFYPSAKEAGIKLNCYSNNITKALKGKLKTSCKRTWKYA